MLLKILARIIIGFILLLVIGFLIGYLATNGKYEVMKTIEEDPYLPAVTIQQYPFHSESYGNPEQATIVIIHGGPGNDFRYLLDLKELSDSFHIVFYDQRGTGLSPRVTAEELTLDKTLDDLNSIIDYYSPNKPVHLIGHSWGAMVASGYIAKNPGRVLKAVLAEPAFLTTEMAKAYALRTNNMSLSLSWPLLKYLIKSWFQSIHVRGPDQQSREDFLSGRLIMDYQEEHLKYFRNVQLVVIENAGHYMINDKPAECIKTIKEFICKP